LVAGIESPKEKAAVLYQYLQEHMRYVSIQLGIGGFQPFSASEVDKLGYGDCKALSNYYISLLKLAGIQGLYALTTASSDHQGFYEDFPANIYFNHAVVCIPFQNDTTWVECTNNYLPFGFMGRRVAGQPALLITAEGGVLTKIPQLPGDKNNEFRRLKINLNEEGDALMELNVHYLGEQLTDGLAEYVKSPSEQLKSIYNDLEISEFKVLSHQYSFQKGANPGIHLNAKLQGQGLAQISGNRMFIPVQLLDNPISTPELAEHRKFPVHINWSYFDSDTIVLSVPTGYSVEMLPKPFVSVADFGVYELNVSANQDEVVIIKSFRLKAGRYPSESYTALRDFLLQIHKANRQKLIVRKSA
jgi:hypothetical protein